MNFLKIAIVLVMCLYNFSALGMHGTKKYTYKPGQYLSVVRPALQAPAKKPESHQKALDKKTAQEQKLPLLSQKKIVEHMGSSTLCMLAQGILEQDSLDKKSITRAKELLATAAHQPSPDPLAFYLLGQTEKAIASDYVPALYMQSLKGIEQSRPQVSLDKQLTIDTLLTTLKKHKLPAEITIPKVQAKLTDAQPDSFAQKITLEESVAMLQRIIDRCSGNPKDPRKPWTLRSCYALGMLQAGGFGSFYQLDRNREKIQPIAIAACEGFEPAIYEFVRLRLQENNVQCESFLEQYNNFKCATKHLREAALASIEAADSLESLLEDSIVCIHFYEQFNEYISDVPVFNKALHAAMQVLTTIDETTHDYRARCLQAIITLNRRTPKSLANAYELLEPLFTNKEIQGLLAMHTCAATKKFLKDNATSDPQASFLLGLMLCAQKSTQQQAYQCFLRGAEKNHFYSLLSTANMILKGFDQEKSPSHALIFYKKALKHAPSQTSKKQVIDILKSIANKTFIPAHCLYLIVMLQDAQEQSACYEIVATIEASDSELFNRYINCLRTNFSKDLKIMSEQGNALAARLLGYIHLENQNDQIFNPDELNTILDKLRGHCTTPRSRQAASLIAFALGKHYKNSGDDSEALRLFTLAAECGHQEAINMSALLRLKMIMSSSFEHDIKLVEKLADQGNLEAQEFLENNPTCMILLAKMLCSQNADLATDHNDQRVFALFTRAKQLGYQLKEGDYRTFGIIAFNINQDEQAIELLEQCDPDKTILWLLSVLYLRHQDTDKERLQMALQALDRVLRIENDDIALPIEGVDEGPSVLEALSQHCRDDAHIAELFLRLCYAQGLDTTILPQRNLFTLANLLENNLTLSRWNLLFFLQRQGIKIHVSCEPLWALFETHILNQKIYIKNDSSYQECINQLTPVANLLESKNFSKQSLEDAIEAAHLLSAFYCEENLLDACLYCVLAEDAITTNFNPNSPIYNYAKTIGAFDKIAEKARTHQEAAITTMIYKGYRYLRGHQDIEEIIEWLQLSESIMNRLKNYKGKQDTKKDKLIALFYVLVGKLTLIAHQNNAEILFESSQYFKKALKLYPQLAQAQAHLSFIQIYNPASTDNQRLNALFALEKLAKQCLPEACYMLGKIYEPGAAPLPGSFQVRPNAKTAQKYLAHAACYKFSSETPAHNSWFPCTIL